jgi:hypothetical protein
VGRECRPVQQHGRRHAHPASPQARRPTSDRDCRWCRVPAVSGWP